jgi:hypothetical protein
MKACIINNHAVLWDGVIRASHVNNGHKIRAMYQYLFSALRSDGEKMHTRPDCFGCSSVT